MLHVLAQRFRRKMRLFGLLAAIVALAGQVALGGVVPPVSAQQAQLAALSAASIICHASNNSGNDNGKTLPQPVSDWVLCPLDHALAQVGMLLSPSPVILATPVMPALRIALMPPARAPPSHIFSTVYPRGPPTLT
jgi:hypothetical protein